MASVTQLVRFRMLLDELSDTEFRSFLTDLATKCGRDVICAALFNHFSDQKQATFSQQSLESMMKITEEIILSRKSSDIVDDGPSGTMQSLLPALIGKITTYLEFCDYVSFGRCQRATYIGCNLPCTLRALDLLDVINYRQIDLSNYPQIQYLALDLRSFDDLVLPNNKNICTHLKTLELCGGNVDDADIDGFLNQTALPFTAITHLKLLGFGDYDEEIYFSTNTMMDLLSKFPNTQCLSMDGVFCSLDESSTLRLIKYFPKFNALLARYCNQLLLYRIISVWGEQLKALKIKDENMMEIPHNVCFKAMEELSVTYPPGTRSVMDSIRRSTKSLQRIHFCWGEPDKSSVISLLSEQKELEQLVIYTTYQDFPEVSEALNRAIFNIRKTEKKCIEIKVELKDARIGCRSTASASDIIYNLIKVVNALKLSKIKHFLFRCNLLYSSVGTIENLESELRYLKETNAARVDVKLNDNEIVVTNHGYAKSHCVFGDLFRGWLTENNDIWWC